MWSGHRLTSFNCYTWIALFLSSRRRIMYHLAVDWSPSASLSSTAHELHSMPLLNIIKINVFFRFLLLLLWWCVCVEMRCDNDAEGRGQTNRNEKEQSGAKHAPLLFVWEKWNELKVHRIQFQSPQAAHLHNVFSLSLSLFCSSATLINNTMKIYLFHLLLFFVCCSIFCVLREWLWVYRHQNTDRYRYIHVQKNVHLFVFGTNYQIAITQFSKEHMSLAASRWPAKAAQQRRNTNFLSFFVLCLHFASLTIEQSKYF